MAAGIRVIRGPDWNLGDTDGGEGHVGTVAEVKDNDVAKVVWDGGHVTMCRAGKDQGHDLRVLDNATVGVRHQHILCDECHESGIVGIRWKCTECDDYDLCSPCYFSDAHDPNHAFYRIEIPGASRDRQEKRSKSMKMRVLGIFPDATVVRGPDWEWNDQDGGAGSTGVVLELLTAASQSSRSTAKVEWQSGKKNVYRVGHKGKMDLQYTEEAPGIECYPQHLPVFVGESYLKLEEEENITEGDSVVIKVDAAELQRLQKARSGWAVGMAGCIGNVGKVQGFAANGDAIVMFANKKYRLFPGALKKVASLSVGSRVRILEDEERVKSLQDGHGGYNDRMKACLGKVGEVIKIDSDGDVVVKFGDRHWVFAPACCVDAPDADIDFISSDSDGGDSIKLRLGGNSTGGDLLGLLAALAQATGQAGDGVFLKAVADKQESAALDMLRRQPKLAKSRTEKLTALHIAANRGLLRLTAALLDAGADINGKDNDGDSPVMVALAGGCADVAEMLVKKGADVCAQNKNGQTASHIAVIGGFCHVLRELKTHGADFNAQDNSGDTPLHDAITKGRVEAADILLSWPRLDLHRANKKGHPPLHYACMKDEPLIVERIIGKDKTTVDERKEDGYTPMHVCACNNHSQSMKVLIEKGKASVSIPNNEQQRPLHVAAHEAALECAELLIGHGARVDVKDGMGNTPLHVLLAGMAMGSDQLAAILQLLGQSSKLKAETRTRLACLLIEHGADPDARNNDGLKALDACPSSHDKVKEAIKNFIEERRSNPRSSQRTSTDSLSSGQYGRCRKCLWQSAEVLFVPCGHRVVCRECCSGVSRCVQCSLPVKQMFDKDGKKLKTCIVM